MSVIKRIFVSYYQFLLGCSTTEIIATVTSGRDEIGHNRVNIN